MAVGLKEASLLGVAGVVAWFGANLLPPHPGVELVVKAVGTLACVGGGAIGIAVTGLSRWRIAGLVIACVVVGGLGIVGFNEVATGPPGGTAALLLYALSAIVFLPLGILIQLAGLALGADDGEK